MSGLGDGCIDGRFDALYASAREARSRAQLTVRRAEGILEETKAAWQAYQEARAWTERLRELWLSGQQDAMRYSASARLHARLASMPVIEQAKGVLMAQCGWTAEEAFDALRQASQRSNIRVRDLADIIVAKTADGPAQARKPSGRQAQQRAVGPVGTVQALPTQRRRRDSLVDPGGSCPSAAYPVSDRLTR